MEPGLSIKTPIAMAQKSNEIPAAQKLIQYRVALGKKEAAKSEPDRTCGLDLSGMTDADLDALIDRLLPAYLADRERRHRGDGAAGAGVP